MADKHNALVSLCPGAEFVLRNNELEWLDTKQTQPTDEEIDAEIVRLQTEYDANRYQRDRELAFASIGIGNQLDMQYWDQVNGTTTWKDAVAKVKEDNPKPDGWKE